MQHINPGEPIRASMLNQLIDHADGVTEGQIGGIPNFRVSSTTIRVQADADLPRYAVVGIDDILFDPAVNKEAFSKEPAVKAGQPNAATKNFAILQQPATSEQIVPACVSGVSITELVIEDSQHEFAVPNEDYTMTTAESGVARILWKQTTPGDDGKTWGLVSFPVGGGGGTPTPSVEYCTLITPVSNGFNSTIIGTDSVSTTHGFNALRAGLGKLSAGGTGSPLQVLTEDSDSGTLVPKMSGDEPLYYKALTIKTHSGAATPEYDLNGTIEYNELSGTQNFAGHAVLYAFLQSLQSGETAENGVQYDYSDVWETTTDIAEAIQDNLVMVRPHLITGWYCTKGSFKVLSKETIDISIGIRTQTADVYSLDFELNATVRFKGQWNGTIKYATLEDEDITWETLDDIEDYIEHLNEVMIVIPEYNGSNIAIMDTNKIENTCGLGSTPVPVPMGIYIDANGLPQFVNCDSIPFQCMVPLLTVVCLYRMNDNNCSPAYQTNQFPVHMAAPFLRLQTVNYIPGSNC